MKNDAMKHQMGAMGEALGDKIDELSYKGKETMEEVTDKVKDYSEEYISQVEKYVQDNPWKGLMIAASVGILFYHLLSK